MMCRIRAPGIVVSGESEQIKRAARALLLESLVWMQGWVSKGLARVRFPRIWSCWVVGGKWVRMVCAPIACVFFFFFWVGLRRAVVGGAKGKEDQGIVVRKG